MKNLSGPLQPKHVVSFSATIKEAGANAMKRPQDPFEGLRFEYHSQSKGDNADNLIAFRNAPCALLCSCMMAGEGIDMPNIDAVVFGTAGKIQPVRVIQSLGRTLRKGGSSQVGIMRINCSLEQVNSVVDALVQHDHRLWNAARDGDSGFIRSHFKPCDTGIDLTAQIISRCKTLNRPPVFGEAAAQPAGQRPGQPAPQLSAPTAAQPTVPAPTQSPAPEPRQSAAPSPTQQAAQLTMPPAAAIETETFFSLSEDRQKATSSGFLYRIVEEGTSFFKIGRSVDPENRLRALQTGNPRRLVLSRHLWRVENNLSGFEADVLKSLSSSMIAERCQGVLGGGAEWFSLRHNITFATIDARISELAP